MKSLEIRSSKAKKFGLVIAVFLSGIFLFVSATVQTSAASEGGSQPLRFTIEAPGVQESQVTCPVPGTSLQEDFDSLSGGGVNQITGGTLGDYVASGPFLTIFGQDLFGGADVPNNSTKNYLELEGSDVEISATLDLTASGGPGPVGYFGFWWSAGDGNNRLEITKFDGSVETFTTQSIMNSPALEGSPNGNSQLDGHFGNPTTAFSGQNADEAYAFVNIYAQDEASKITLVRFFTEESGFESDNHTICTELIDGDNQQGTDLGGIIIRKVSNPTSGTGFGFTDDIEDPFNFTLNHNEEEEFISVAPGSYTVTEDDPGSNPGGFELTDITCVDGDENGSPSSGDVGTRTATINVDVDETVTCTFTNEGPRDFGDAPDTNGQTSGVNRAYHVINNSVYLGPTAPDAEANGIPTANADGDDTQDQDDEDDLLAIDMDWNDGGSVDVNVSNVSSIACVYGWVDWDSDGFGVGSDSTSMTEVTADGAATLVFPDDANIPPSGSFPGTAYLRLRVVDGACSTLAPTGGADSGEVEDHALNFNPTAVSLQAVSFNNHPSITLIVVFILSALMLAMFSLMVLRRRATKASSN